jgi:hypothetical protein
MEHADRASGSIATQLKTSTSAKPRCGRVCTEMCGSRRSTYRSHRGARTMDSLLEHVQAAAFRGKAQHLADGRPVIDQRGRTASAFHDLFNPGTDLGHGGGDSDRRRHRRTIRGLPGAAQTTTGGGPDSRVCTGYSARGGAGPSEARRYRDRRRRLCGLDAVQVVPVRE